MPENKIRKLFFAIAIVINVLCATSCADKQDYLVVSKDFSEEQWSRFDNITATLDVLKAPMNVDVVMDLTLSDDFPNIYPYYKNDGDFLFCMLLEGADGSSRAKEYKFVLKDSEGNWKSEKIDDYYHFSFPLINELNIGEKGSYKFTIENKYTKDPLFGIKNLTVRCVPSKIK